MPNTEHCPHKDGINKEAKDAKGHIDNVLADPSLSQNLKNELNLAKKNLDKITMDNHK